MSASTAGGSGGFFNSESDIPSLRTVLHHYRFNRLLQTAPVPRHHASSSADKHRRVHRESASPGHVHSAPTATVGSDDSGSSR